MASKKGAVFQTGEKGVNRVAVIRRPRSKSLYLERWEELPSGKVVRRVTSLGNLSVAKAKGLAEDMASELRARQRQVAPAELTTAELFDKYEAQVTPTKAAGTQSHDRRALRLLAECWGPQTPVSRLRAADWDRYIRNRRSGLLRPPGARGGPVKARAVEQDLRLARAVFNWAVQQELLRDVPMAKGKIPVEENPKRAILFEEDYRRMLEVADQVYPLCRLALVLAHETGHRINAIRLLRWSDVDLERRVIRWRSENDKQRREHVCPISDVLLVELEQQRRHESGLLFPSDRKPGHPLRREVFVTWWGAMEVRSGLAHSERLGWHALRRKWATERKSLPVTDVAAAGGWTSTQTLQLLYFQPDDATMRRVVASRTPLQRSPRA